jgi:c-di-GMP-binding flagellar brake protein YcgR
LTSKQTAKGQVARYPFEAKAIIQESSSEKKIWGHTSDLSGGGCGVRAEGILPRGTKVELEIVKGNLSLRTTATVAFAVQPYVMGLAFEEMSAESREVLEHWLENVIPKMGGTL